MKPIVAVLLVAAGIAVIVMGSRKEDSIAGKLDEAATDVANQFDGEARQPEHIWYYVGGGVLIVLGGAVFFRKRAV